MSSTNQTPAPAPTTATPKVSWLKKFGQDVVKVVEFIAGKAQPIAAAAGAVVSAIDPVLAPEISVAESLVTKIANQATVTEAAFAAVGQGSNGAAKLQAVLESVGPEIDSWVASAFPGAAALSKTAQAGLVNAVVGILNDIDPNLALTNPTASAVSAATAAKAAVAATGAPATS
jgi:hypothetical protein